MKLTFKFANMIPTVLLIAAASLIFFGACASIHSGNFATPVGSEQLKSVRNISSLGLVISGQEVLELASKYITAIDLTFENTTPQWMRIDKIEVSFGGSELDKKIFFLIGNDLFAWSEAAKQQQAIRDHNTDLFLGSVLALGAGMAIGENGGDTRAVGASLAATSGSVLAASSIGRELQGLELAKVVPSNHLFSTPFIIPPGLHTKKFLVLYTEKPLDIGYVANVLLRYTTATNKSEQVKLSFRWDRALSSWQDGHKNREKGPSTRP